MDLYTRRRVPDGLIQLETDSKSLKVTFEDEMIGILKVLKQTQLYL